MGGGTAYQTSSTGNCGADQCQTNMRTQLGSSSRSEQSKVRLLINLASFNALQNQLLWWGQGAAVRGVLCQRQKHLHSNTGQCNLVYSVCTCRLYWPVSLTWHLQSCISLQFSWLFFRLGSHLALLHVSSWHTLGLERDHVYLNSCSPEYFYPRLPRFMEWHGIICTLCITWESHDITPLHRMCSTNLIKESFVVMCPCNAGELAPLELVRKVLLRGHLFHLGKDREVSKQVCFLWYKDYVRLYTH